MVQPQQCRLDMGNGSWRLRLDSAQTLKMGPTRLMIAATEVKVEKEPNVC